MIAPYLYGEESPGNVECDSR